MTVYRGLKHKIVQLGRFDSPEGIRFLYMSPYSYDRSETSIPRWLEHLADHMLF